MLLFCRNSGMFSRILEFSMSFKIFPENFQEFCQLFSSFRRNLRIFQICQNFFYLFERVLKLSLHIKIVLSICLLSSQHLTRYAQLLIMFEKNFWIFVGMLTEFSIYNKSFMTFNGVSGAFSSFSDLRKNLIVSDNILKLTVEIVSEFQYFVLNHRIFI